MPAMEKSVELIDRMVHGLIEEMMPDSVPKPPRRPPGEPIIIRDPSRPPQAPEIDGSLDEDEEEVPEIKRPPEIIPEMPPPPRPGNRRNRCLARYSRASVRLLAASVQSWTRAFEMGCNAVA
jgi:hypothetical protein